MECAREPSPSPGNWEAGFRAEWQFPRGCDGVTGGTGGEGRREAWQLPARLEQARELGLGSPPQGSVR